MVWLECDLENPCKLRWVRHARRRMMMGLTVVPRVRRNSAPGRGAIARNVGGASRLRLGIAVALAVTVSCKGKLVGPPLPMEETTPAVLSSAGGGNVSVSIPGANVGGSVPGSNSTLLERVGSVGGAYATNSTGIGEQGGARPVQSAEPAGSGLGAAAFGGNSGSSGTGGQLSASTLPTLVVEGGAEGSLAGNAFAGSGVTLGVCRVDQSLIDGCILQ